MVTELIGNDPVIAGLCESPLTFQAIIIWRDELNEGRTLLREIIDLETTYAGPEAKAAPQVERPAEEVKARIDERTKRYNARRDEEDITNVGGEGMPIDEEEEEEEYQTPSSGKGFRPGSGKQLNVP